MFKRIISLLISVVIALSGFSFAYAEDTKLIYSESFENGFSVWSYGNNNSEGSVYNDDTNYTDGKKSVLIIDNSEEKAPAIASPEFDVKGGVVYTSAVDLRAQSGAGARLFLKYFDGEGKQLVNKSAGVKGFEWGTAFITETAPDNAKTARMFVSGVAATLGETFIDNARFYEGVFTPSKVTGVSTGEKKDGASLKSEDTKKDGEIVISESFENGFGEWTYANNQSSDYITAADKDASEGSRSIMVTDDSAELAPGIKSPMFPVSGDTAYTIFGDINILSGDSVRMFVKFYNSAGDQVLSKSILGEAGGWSLMRGQFTTPSDAINGQVFISTLKASLGVAYVDNVRVFKGSVKLEAPETKYIAPSQVTPVNATLVSPVGDKLSYPAYNPEGDSIGDFSYGGFYGGDYELPVTANLPVAMELSPSADPNADDTERIQAAIDTVYEQSANDKMKVIRLKAGTYNINKQGISLKSGILLSGEGQSVEGTILYAKDAAQYIPVNIAGTAPVIKGKTADIIDNYVKAGSKTFNISETDAVNFKVGDLIVIHHPSTVKWSEAIGMYGITNNTGVDHSWKDGNVDMITERTITGINGTEITVDFPLYVPLMKEYTQSYIYKIADDSRIQNCGIENLRIVSYYNGDPEDENHATSAIVITNAKNCFVRDVSAKHFYDSLVRCGARAKQISVVNCSSLEPVSKIAGSRRYSFACSTSAQQLLYTGCYSYDGRHDFETSGTVTGPIVFIDNVADSSNAASETHGTWSTGVLYDNLYHISSGTKGFISLGNHGIYGSNVSQGWCAAGSLVWNSLSSAIICHKPPLTYQNFVVGTWGIYKDTAGTEMKQNNINRYYPIYRTKTDWEAKPEFFATKEGSSAIGDTYFESEFTPVEPRSLFKAQLSERYTGTIKNARPNAPIIVYPKYDKVTSENTVNVSGAYQLGADKVTVYIDNNPYNASLNTDDNTFSVNVTLTEGTHKIYATQTIGQIEGNKTADRFITIGKSTGNHDYLQSVYSPDKMRLIINDPRPTYDEYEKSIAVSDEIKIFIDGAKLYSDVAPYEISGRVLVPMRAIFEELKATVTWDEATATATAVSSNELITVKITENMTTAYVNNQPVILDVPATITNGRFVVPVRFISESFGATVGWIDAKKTVTIKSTYMSDNPKHVPTRDAKWSMASTDDRTGVQAIDGDKDSRWAGDGVGVWMSAQFIQSAKITSFKTLFANQDKRSYNFEIHFSTDGVNFTKAFEGTTSGNIEGDTFKLQTPTEAKYFKFVGKGGSNGDWMLLHEIEFYRE